MYYNLQTLFYFTEQCTFVNCLLPFHRPRFLLHTSCTPPTRPSVCPLDIRAKKFRTRYTDMQSVLRFSNSSPFCQKTFVQTQRTILVSQACLCSKIIDLQTLQHSLTSSSLQLSKEGHIATVSFSAAQNCILSSPAHLSSRLLSTLTTFIGQKILSHALLHFYFLISFFKTPSFLCI